MTDKVINVLWVRWMGNVLACPSTSVIRSFLPYFELGLLTGLWCLVQWLAWSSCFAAQGGLTAPERPSVGSDVLSARRSHATKVTLHPVSLALRADTTPSPTLELCGRHCPLFDSILCTLIMHFSQNESSSIQAAAVSCCDDDKMIKE